jgi:tripeptide aminopeptidase
MATVLDRFLRYVRYDTQANESSTAYPSTPGQLVLLNDLVRELQALGLADASIDQYGYVTATIPSTSSRRDVPVIGFIAHVDTSPEMSGAGVKPIVHRAYDGRDLVLPDDPSAVLRGDDSPYLRECLGHDIVTASGTTLLGADNKAGVAEIVTAVEYLLAHPELRHGPIRIAFTPDEEIGRGTKHFDVAAFGAMCAYTMDGGERGDLEYESFSADAFTATFIGFNTHPGFAKGHMVNAIKAAAAFIDLLPRDTLAPEHTEGYEGFVHPYAMQGRRRSHLGAPDRPRFPNRGTQDERSAPRLTRPSSGFPFSGLASGDHGRRAVPEHARSARSASGRRRSRARSHAARRLDDP